MADAVPPTRIASGNNCCRRATAERTCSQSGSEMRFGIVHPKMVALRAWISDMRAAHPLNLLQNNGALHDGDAQFLPLLPLATRDHVVNGRKAQLLMIKVPVNHGSQDSSLKSTLIPTHPRGDVNLGFSGLQTGQTGIRERTMFTVTANTILPCTITGSWPRPR